MTDTNTDTEGIDNRPPTRRTALAALAAAGIGLAGLSGVATADEDGNDDTERRDPTVAVDTVAMRQAIADWRADEIETETLRYVIDRWRDEGDIRDVIEDWRGDEIDTDTLRYVIDLWRGSL